jgi:hypothetical protein
LRLKQNNPEKGYGMSKPVDSNIAQVDGRHEEPLASRGNLSAIASDFSV